MMIYIYHSIIPNNLHGKPRAHIKQYLISKYPQQHDQEDITIEEYLLDIFENQHL